MVAADDSGSKNASPTDDGGTVVVADFALAGTAWDATAALKSIEDGQRGLIDGVVVVSRAADGALAIQDDGDQSAENGLAWGAVGGIVLGLVFPPSILGSAIVLGAAGAATGKLRQLRHRSELEGKLEDSIAPGHFGVVVLVSGPSALTVRSALSGADSVSESAVSASVARAIKALAQGDESVDIEGPPVGGGGIRPQPV
jgi:uncharacterized membrane protein